MIFNAEIRPWGMFENMYTNPDKTVKVKKIIINPHSRLSLQSHNHRSEIWFCSEGEGSYQLEDTIYDMSKGMPIFIPINIKHRIINNSDNPLVIIEIQTGDILIEDDIIRYQDDYNR